MNDRGRPQSPSESPAKATTQQHSPRCPVKGCPSRGPRCGFHQVRYPKDFGVLRRMMRRPDSTPWGALSGEDR